MLQKVILENFQAHEYSEINFTEGINVICGASDQGKSSVIRAIRWAIENRPSGFGFKRIGAKKPTRVTLIFDSGKIIRHRSETENYYEIHKGKEQPIVYKALRSDVPKEVLEVSGFGSYNIQMQKPSDTAFLISDSDSEVAKKINNLSGVSLIDDILKENNSRIRAEKAKETATKELLSSLKTKVSNFKYLGRLEKILKQTTEMHTEINDYRKYHAQLQSLVASLKTLNAKPVVDVVSTAKHLKSAKTSAESYLEYQQYSKDLSGHINNLRRASQRLAKFQNLKQANEALADARACTASLQDSKIRAERLKACLANLRRSEAGWKASVAAAKKAIDDLAAFKKEHKLCPVCNKKW